MKSASKVFLLALLAFFSLSGSSGGAVKVGTTVITHGLRPLGSNTEIPKLDGDLKWVYAMARKIAERAPQARIYVVGKGKISAAKGSGKDDHLRNFFDPIAVVTRNEFPSGFDPDSPTENIILFDWVEESNNNCDGYSEAAGDALSAYLIRGQQNGYWKLNNLHFIGHSRGPVVNSEAIQRLLYFASNDMLPEGVDVDKSIHMTTLDPHPEGHWANASDLFGNIIEYINILANVHDDNVSVFNKLVTCGNQTKKECGVIGWKANAKNDESYMVSHIDNYWQEYYPVSPEGFLRPFSAFWGLEAYPGLSQNGGVYGMSFDPQADDHSAVHEWYEKTVDVNTNEVKGFRFADLSNPSEALQRVIKTGDNNLIDVKDDESFFSDSQGEAKLLFNGDLSKTCLIKGLIANHTPGWIYQGGKGDGNIRSNPLGDPYIELDNFVKNNTSRSHNITYIPKNAHSLHFEYRLTSGKGYLDVSFSENPGGNDLPFMSKTLDLNNVEDDSKYFSAEIDIAKYSARTAFLKFKIRRQAKTLNPFWPNLYIRNIRFSTLTPGLEELGGGLASSLIFDRSGSMKESADGTSAIKIDRAKQAVGAYIKNMPDSDNVSISTFSDKGETPLPMSKASSVRNQLNQTLSKILPSGRTNIGDGLSKGLEELNKTSGDQQMAILLSDGKNNVPGWEDVVKKYQNRKWSICTLGFGKDADEETLTKIATETGCVYKYAESTDLINSFQELSAYAHNKSINLSIHDLLLEKERLGYVFNVAENADSFNVYTSWPGSKLSTKLIDPDGRMITDAEAKNAGGRYEEGKTFQMLEIKDPAPGTWNIEVSWAEAPPVPEQVNISIAEKSDVFAWMNGFRPMYSVSEPVTINVNAANVVNNKKIPLIGGTVTAEIIKPGADVIRMVQAQSSQWTMFKDVLKDNTREVTLYDDGNHNDYKAGDGVFGGIYRETDKNGAYLVNATIRGEKQNGESVEKLISGSFQVGPITNNPVTSSQSLRYTREAQRHFQRPNHTLQQLDSTHQLDSIEDLQDSADPLESIDQLDGGDPLESIDNLMRSGG